MRDSDVTTDLVGKSVRITGNRGEMSDATYGGEFVGNIGDIFTVLEVDTVDGSVRLRDHGYNFERWCYARFVTRAEDQLDKRPERVVEILKTLLLHNHNSGLRENQLVYDTALDVLRDAGYEVNVLPPTTITIELK
jgi:hypothetical protein